MLPFRNDESSSKLLHHTEALDDSYLQWMSPDEAVTVPFSRDRQAALELASEYDLCISGDGLTHLHKIGADPSFVPLAQVNLPLPSHGLTPIRCGRSEKLSTRLQATASLTTLTWSRLMMLSSGAGFCQGVPRSEGAHFEGLAGSWLDDSDVR